jgi:tripartite-type tricarboxylate transporter receptor subunit TctC
VKCVLASLLALVVTGVAHAQSWPAKPVRMVIPYPAGGSVDVSGRRLAEDLGAELGQPIVVENRAGANGIIATDFVAKSPPDGYTMLVSTLAAHAGNPAAVKSLPYDPVKDFAPVTVINTVPLLLVVHPSFPAQSIADIVRMARERPGKINFASFGTGGMAHLAGVQLELRGDVKMVHVPYKGGGPAANDLIGGHIPMAFLSLSSAVPQLATGKIRIVALVDKSRYAAMPDVPTIGETIPGFEMSSWLGVFAPAATPAPLVAKIGDAVTAIFNDPPVKQRLGALGLVVTPITRQELAEIIKRDSAIRAGIIKAAKIQSQ